MKAKLVLSTILLVTFLSGCSIGGGSRPRIIEPTLGEELMDLHQALENGAITTNEYVHLKEKLKRTSYH